jgi:hypothetical protein
VCPSVATGGDQVGAGSTCCRTGPLSSEKCGIAASKGPIETAIITSQGQVVLGTGLMNRALESPALGEVRRAYARVAGPMGTSSRWLRRRMAKETSLALAGPPWPACLSPKRTLRPGGFCCGPLSAGS